MQIQSASNGFAKGTYLDMPWTARRIDGAWVFKTAKPVTAGGKANIAKEINKKIEGKRVDS